MNTKNSSYITYVKRFFAWAAINISYLYGSLFIVEYRDRLLLALNSNQATSANILIKFLLDFINIIAYTIPILFFVSIPLTILIYMLDNSRVDKLRYFFGTMFCLVFALRWTTVTKAPFEIHTIEYIYLFLSSVLFSYTLKPKETNNIS
jgi:hypothetical protein